MIVKTIEANYSVEDFQKMGITTEYQKRAVLVLADLTEQVTKTKDNFFFMTFFIGENDLLNHRPVEIISNLPNDDQLEFFNNYVLDRLKMRKLKAAGGKE